MARSAAARVERAPHAPTRTRPRRAPARHAPARRKSGAAPSRKAAVARPAVKPQRQTVKPRPQTRTARRRRAAVQPRGAMVLDRLLRGRAWVACVGALLAGIVFLNVSVLETNEGIARTSEKVTQLKRDNAALRKRYARVSSTERIQRLAARQGLVLPAAGKVRYLTANPNSDGRRAARTFTKPKPQIIPPPEPVTLDKPAPQATTPTQQPTQPQGTTPETAPQTATQPETTQPQAAQPQQPASTTPAPETQTAPAETG